MNIWDEGKELPHLLYIRYNHNKRKRRNFNSAFREMKEQMSLYEIFIAQKGWCTIIKIDRFKEGPLEKKDIGKTLNKYPPSLEWSLLSDSL